MRDRIALLYRIEKLNNKELNNRLTLILFPKMIYETYHFTNEPNLVNDYLIPKLIKLKFLSEILLYMSQDNIKQDEFNRRLCQHALCEFIGE